MDHRRAWISRLVGVIAPLALCGCSAPIGLDIHSMHIESVKLDPRTSSPVILLREEHGARRWLPIWIGVYEARSIAMELEHQPSQRPNTHDLAKRLILGLEGEVVRVVVTELRKGTYFATISLRSMGKTIDIDARPSDAIAIALRAEAPIFVRASLLDEKKSKSTTESGRAI